MAAYTGVHLAFKHALSSIVFSVRTKEDYKTANGAIITLTGLSISNIGKTSTFNQGITDGNLATSAAEWDEPSTKTTTYVAYDGLKEITTTRYWTSTDAYNTDKHTASSGGYRDTDFILLPQTLATAKLNVSYKIQYEGVGAPVEMSKTVDLTDVNIPKWEMGKRYIYNIIISLGTKAIRFDVADISLTTKSDDADIAEKHILYSGATLNFTDKRNLGVYGNLADYGADDIFANGNGTSIDLPDISQMQLSGFDVPTDELYWVEDYPTKDTEYNQGTNINTSDTATDELPERYRDAINALHQIYTIPEGQSLKCYTCLALG